MSLSDHDIIERIRAGASHQYALLIDRYKAKGMTLALRILRNHEDAEEALQDAFVRVYRGLEEFEGRSKFSTWFYRILYNVCLTKLGERKTEFDRVSLDQEADEHGEVVADSSSLQEEIEMKDLLAHAQRAIERLPAKFATIISLFYIQDLSHEEISEVTKLPIGTIKTHLFRARAALQNELQKDLVVEHW